MKPTTVLYYFVSDNDSASPIGLIDLSVFSESSCDDAAAPELKERPGGHAMRLSCPADPYSRAYWLADGGGHGRSTRSFAGALASRTGAAQLAASEERARVLRSELVAAEASAVDLRAQLALEQRKPVRPHNV